jgi:hypothetical protein
MAPAIGAGNGAQMLVRILYRSLLLRGQAGRQSAILPQTGKKEKVAIVTSSGRVPFWSGPGEVRADSAMV